MLVVQPSARDKRRGQDQPQLFIPELCVITGKIKAKIKFKKIRK